MAAVATGECQLGFALEAHFAGARYWVGYEDNLHLQFGEPPYPGVELYRKLHHEEIYWGANLLRSAEPGVVRDFFDFMFSV
jgi:uncharacterized protein (DUF849 family)